MLDHWKNKTYVGETSGASWWGVQKNSSLKEVVMTYVCTCRFRVIYRVVNQPESYREMLGWAPKKKPVYVQLG